MELQILASILDSRDAYEKVAGHLDSREMAPIFGAIYDAACKYYDLDKDAKLVDIEVIRNNLQNDLSSAAMVEQMHEVLNEIEGVETSEVNVVRQVLNKKIHDVGQELAQAILTHNRTQAAIMLEKYQELLEKDSLEVQADEELVGADLEELIARTYNEENVIQLSPKSLNDALDGGISRGHHIILAARPEASKTATAIQLTCGVAYQGKKVLYYCNEEPVHDIIIRTVSNMSGMTTKEVRQNPKQAYKRALKMGYGNVVFVFGATNTLWEIRSLIKKYEPDMLVVDQIRNLNVKAEGSTHQLERAAKGVRSLAGHYNLLAISVTQAGESAQDKAILTISDIDNSKTGIPASCDVMMLIGVTDELRRMGRRCITLAKNKVSGRHESWRVAVNDTLSRVTDVQ